jgi:hypothetical protein
MYKVIALALAASLMWGITAWAADDDGWDEWDAAWADFNGETHSHDVAERSLRASEPIYQNVKQEDGSILRELLYAPAPGEGGAGYNPDQVYGPMWGVPGDAVGMDGYEPFYLMQYLNADPQDIPEEYRGEVEKRRAELEALAATYGAENPQQPVSSDQMIAAPGQQAAPAADGAAPAGKAPAEKKAPAKAKDDDSEKQPESEGIQDSSGDWFEG